MGTRFLIAGAWRTVGRPHPILLVIALNNHSGYCSGSLDARMDEALLLQSTDPEAANRAWADIEPQLVEEAAQAPLTNPSRPAPRTSRSTLSGGSCSAASGSSSRRAHSKSRGCADKTRSADNVSHAYKENVIDHPG